MSEEAQGKKVQTFVDMLLEDFCPLIWKPEEMEDIGGIPSGLMPN